MILFAVIVGVFVLLLTIVVLLMKVSLSRKRIGNIHKRTVFITGCDTGFGNLLARQLDGLGVRVIAACLTEKGRSDLTAATSSRLKTVLLDITDRQSVQDAFIFVSKNLDENGLWGVVNNAGVMPTFAPCEWTSVEDFEAVCKVNLFGTISVTLAFLPLLRQSGGRLVNVCSVTSNCGYPGIANYVISKAGVQMFSICLRRELLNANISTHVIEPGGFRTNITDTERLLSLMQKSYMKASPELQEFYGGTIGTYLMQGLKHGSKYVRGKPQSVADAMCHALLASYPKMRYIVGTDAHIFFRLLTVLPEKLVDYMLGWPAPYGKPCEEFNLKVK